VTQVLPPPLLVKGEYRPERIDGYNKPRKLLPVMVTHGCILNTEGKFHIWNRELNATDQVTCIVAESFAVGIFGKLTLIV